MSNKLGKRVQIRLRPRYVYYNQIEHYWVEYRIHPDDLTWIVRTFFNRWKRIPVEHRSEKSGWYHSVETPDELAAEKQRMKYVSDIKAYQKEQRDEAMRWRDEHGIRGGKSDKIYY